MGLCSQCPALLNGSPTSRFSSEPPVHVVSVVFRPIRQARTTEVSVAVQRRLVVAVAAAAETTAPAKEGEEVGTSFIKEIRAVATRLQSRDHAREGKEEVPMEPPVAKWQPTVEGNVRFLVDNKLVFDFKTLEAIVDRATVPWYAKFRDTGLERSEPLMKDLEWFRRQGHAIPEPSAFGITYASFVEELSEKEPPAFVCHFYTVYFAHTAGGRIDGEKVLRRSISRKNWSFTSGRMICRRCSKMSERGLIELLPYGWSRAEKDRCLGEMEKAFACSVDLCRHMFP